MSIKVLQLVTAFPRSEEEVTITPWLIQTLKGLKERGIDVTVAAPSYKGLGDQELWDIPVKRFRYFPGPWEDLTHDETTPVRLKRKPWYIMQAISLVLSSIPSMKRIARRVQPDIIHVHWPFPLALPGLAAAKAVDAKLVLKFYSAEMVFLRKRAKMLSWVLDRPVKAADLILSISTYAGELFNELYPGKEVEPMPASIVVPEDMQPSTEEDRAHPPEMLFVGRFVPRKGIEVLIRAFDMVRDRLECKLVIVGGGPLEEDLRKLASGMKHSGDIEFAIRIPEKELDRRYREASVFVLPAVFDEYGDTEGLGMVLIEALFRGTPVIGSRAGGIVDIVKDGETGLAVEPGDPEELADAIEIMLRDRELAAKLAEGGLRHVRENFSWNSVADRLVAHYERLTGKKANPR